uniref:Glycerol-3-phosphate dehydrogenase NAD-dependent N-terminal domain-containing protein n=1 Tax=Ananas comosus var. bracteatus TaxID=296719 RepID=A0A6V7NTT5_ANACO|nr:unnamed protein product [Ananas comosus var. bracteatus]
MATLLADPSPSPSSSSLISPLSPSPNPRRRHLPLLSSPDTRTLRIRLRPKPFSPFSVASPTSPPRCPCSAGTLDADPASEENPNPSASSGAAAGAKEGGGWDRRRAVRIAWEKLVRWSRSWRSKNNSDVLERTRKVVVLGGGSFGTAMAAHVASKKAEMEVSMLVRDAHICRAINENHFNCKYFPQHKLPENIVATTNAKDALAGADFCLHAVPVQFSSPFLEGISQHVDPKLPFISLSKGLELNTLRMMSQIIPHALGNPRQPISVLSGPSFAVELVNKLPTGSLAQLDLLQQYCLTTAVQRSRLQIEASTFGSKVSAACWSNGFLPFVFVSQMPSFWKFLHLGNAPNPSLPGTVVT